MAGLVGGTFVLVPPIPQDPDYHNFADSRTVLGVPNFADVLSNLPFAVLAVLGLALLRRGWERLGFERWCWLTFCLGLLGTAAGSACYHLDPDDAALFWDRLPMTVTFMSLVSVVLADRVSEAASRRAWIPLLAAGALSLAWWRVGAARNGGDLRAYALVQYVPLVALPFLLVRPAAGPGTRRLVAALVWYVTAKLLELADHPVMEATRLVSGHTLKHLAASAGALELVLMLRARSAVGAPVGRQAGAGAS